jgi:3-hydroxyisobutyrate dehydrogenase
MEVALLGTGIMGGGIARNLVAAGHDLRVWNRTREKAEAIHGATVADSPADAARGADVLVTMLADGPAVEAAVADLGGFDGLWLQMSTVGVEWTEKLAARGLPFVDAPVLGSRQPAEAGELTVLAAGPRDPRAEDVFDAVGAKTIWLDEVGDATRLKLAFNLYLLLLLPALAQTLELCRRLGIDPGRFLDAVQGTGVDFPYAQTRGRALAAGDYSTNFPLELARKDLALALEAGGEGMPLAETVLELYDRAIAEGRGRDDMIAIGSALS